MTFPTLAVAAVLTCSLAVAAGCQAGPAEADAIRPDVTDIARPSAVAVAYAPPVYDDSGTIPTAAQPVSAPSPVPAVPVVARPVATVPAIHHTHTVQRGETLFAIARSTYGDGRQWHRLAAANPAVASAPLRVGEQLVIP